MLTQISKIFFFHNYFEDNLTEILMLTQISKINFFHNYFEDNLTNVRKTWQAINNFLDRKRKASKHITSL